jgi:hypothetical protein
MSRPPERRNFRFARGPLVGALFGLVLFSGATTEDASVLEARRQKIQTLSQSELNRLKRNYENYLKLPQEKRQQLADLDDELEQDAKAGGHLGKLLDQYNAWLSKLSPFDRDKLLNTPDPGERAELVQKLLQEQKQRSLRAGQARFVALLNGHLDASPRLSAKDLDVVFSAVEQNYLRDESKERLGRTTTARAHHIAVARAVMGQLRRDREAKTNMRAREAALVETILDALPNQAVKDQITRSGLPQQVRVQLGQVLGRSLLAEWEPEIRKAVVTPAEMNRAIDKWLASGVARERRDEVRQRLTTTNAKKNLATVVALQNSLHLQPILWFLRNFPAAPSRGGRLGSAGKQSAKAANRAAEDAEKEPQ